MKIEVSNGELIDKLTILRIKAAAITDSVKLSNIQQELSHLEEASREILPQIESEYHSLLQVNQELWAIEDKIRDLERANNFGEEFIMTARQVYLKNDERFTIKMRINQITGSSFTEEKSYKPY